MQGCRTAAICCSQALLRVMHVTKGSKQLGTMSRLVMSSVTRMYKSPWPPPDVCGDPRLYHETGACGQMPSMQLLLLIVRPVTLSLTQCAAQAERAEVADRVADLEAALLRAQRDGDNAERRAELAERQSAEAHRLILDMQARAFMGVCTAYEDHTNVSVTLHGHQVCYMGPRPVVD